MIALSVAFNITILFGYLYAALVVGPKIAGTSTFTKLCGAGFFITCGLHHLEGAIHLLSTPDATVHDMLVSPHMLLIDGPQAFFIWAFMLGIYNDLIRRPRRKYSGRNESS